MAWWDRHPGELEREVKALEVAGMRPRVSFTEGKAVVDIRLKVLGNERDALLIYPDLYPYFRPYLHVFGLDRNLRHYDPNSGNVCLLQRGTQYWHPQTTAAQHIQEMLPHWEKAAVRKYEDHRLEGEDKQAEPASVYYPAITGQYVMMDSLWLVPPDIQSGRVKIALPKGHRSIMRSESFAAWATEIQGADKTAIEGIGIPECLQKWIKARNYTECLFPWKKLVNLPVARTPEELANILISSDPEVAGHVRRDFAACRSGLYGFCFPEEAPGGGLRDGWLFLAYHYDHKAKRKGARPSPWIVKAEYAGEHDLFERVPELHPLRRKTVALVGLGCVGAPSALALARAGIGELRLLDGDHVSPGTICRWPLGLTVSGTGKVEGLIQFISENYPLTRIGTNHHPFGHKGDCRVTIGACDMGYDQWDCLDKLVEGADLLYDATAEQGINILLADLAAAHKTPYIAVSSRPGGWGGDVLRIRPGKTEGCYICYLHSLRTGVIPHPPYDTEGDELQPVGCGDITFKAASFDVEEIALAGARMAVSTLCEGASGSYPPISHDVGILSLRKEGMATFPEWRGFLLQKHPKCGRCNP